MYLYHVIDKKVLKVVSSVLVSQLKFCVFFLSWVLYALLISFFLILLSKQHVVIITQ